MARADVLALVDMLSAGLADQTICGTLYDETVQMLAASSELFVASEVQTVTAGQATVALPSDAIRLFHAFYDRVQLSPTNQRALEVRPDWREVRGIPSSLIGETEADRTIRLYPVPDVASEGLDFSHGAPLGEDYPDGAVHLLYANAPTNDVPPALDLILALLVLEREFARESNHSHAIYAKTCGELGRILLDLVQL